MKPNLDIDTLTGERRWLASLAHRMVRDRDEADDVVQEAYLAALESPPPADRPARGWLGRVATNVVRMRHRSRTRRTRREEAAVALEPEQTAFDDLHRREAAAVVMRAVEALDEPYRSAVVMRFYGEKSQAEIAEAQGVVVGTAGWRVSEGLKRLRAQLDRDTDGNARRYLMALSPGLGFSTTANAPSSASSYGGMTMSKIAIIVAVALAGASALVVAQRSFASESSAAQGATEVASLRTEDEQADTGAALAATSVRDRLLGAAGKAGRFADPPTRSSEGAPGAPKPAELAFRYTYSNVDGNALDVPTGILRDLPESGAVLRECVTAHLERTGTADRKVSASVRITLRQDADLGVVVADSDFLSDGPGADAELAECMEAGAFAVQIDEPIGEPGTSLGIDVGIEHDPGLLDADKQASVAACVADLERRRPGMALPGEIDDPEFARCMNEAEGLPVLNFSAPSVPTEEAEKLEACIRKASRSASDPEALAGAVAACATELGLTVTDVDEETNLPSAQIFLHRR